jgi:AraC family transcriptional regulator
MSAELLQPFFPPKLSSDQKVWDGFIVGYYRFPAYEVPEHSMTAHRVAIHGSPVKIDVRQDGRRLREHFLKGDLTYTPSGIQFGARWQEEREVLTVLLEPEFVSTAANELIEEYKVETVPHFRFRDPLIKEIGLALGAEVKSGGLLGRLYSEALAHLLVVHIVKRYSTSGRPVHDVIGSLPKHKLRRAIEFINDNLEQNIALAEIATTVEMSPYHFSRLFKQSTGLAPHQYVLEQRIERARTLLSKTALPLVEIAYSLGFTSQSHFTALFRRFTATTPKAYRKSL